MSNFKFEIGQEATITASEEFGVIIGRAEYLDSGNIYFLRYKSKDGRAVENWWNESALETDVA